MPDIKLLKFPSSEEAFLQEPGELKTVCSSRRRSCALVNTPTPCVNKAVCHIQELQTKLEKWGQQGDNAQHETAHENNHSIIWKCVSTEGKNAVGSTELHIEGMGFCVQESGVLTSLWMGATDVLMEVMSLVERLDLDRREAEKALQEEKEKAKKLLERLESLCLWKQNEFPIAMQKEREACSTDIAELTWQLKMRRDQLPQVRDRLTHTEVLNRRLKEDIDFMRKHGPLVHERLQLESEIMKQIQTAQSETNETFSNISYKLKSLQDEFKKEEFRADIENEEMNKEMETIRNQLSGKLSELCQLQSQCEVFHRKIKESVEKLTLRDGQIKALVKETHQFERQETDVNDEVRTLKAEIDDKEEILMLKKEEIMQLQNQIQTSKLEGDEKVSELDAISSQKRRELSTLRDKNQELTLEMEDFKRMTYQRIGILHWTSSANPNPVPKLFSVPKIPYPTYFGIQNEQAVKQLLMDHEHILLKISASEKQWKPLKDELERVSAEHSDTKAKLDQLERQTFLEELRNRKQVDNMKTLIMTEMTTLDILKGNMDAEADEYNREKADCERVKDELQKKYEGTFSTTSQLETEVERLRQIYTEKSETIEKLEAKLNDLQTAQRSLSDDFEGRKKHHQECLNSVKERLSVVLLRYEEITNRIKELDLKSKELKQESDVMEQTVSTMPDVIEELQCLSNTLSFKHGTATVVMGNVQRDIASCEQRKSQHAQIHSALFTQRQAVMKDTEVNLQKALKDNLKLAQEYRKLQRALMIARQEAVCVFDRRNRAEAFVQDHKQLSLLQKRMHKAMLKYFKHRSVYSQAELARFQTLSNQNNQKMKALQEELSNAIQRLSEFLLSLTDDSTTSHVPQQANRPIADAGGSSRKMPTVQIAE
ncbi:coiled-coil domain-containing protein 178 isoform X2 [Ctenopharyngodon idella]|uniref:coiled-coil domain-containing protein 178 isoform X2 n=1 Tax=Ctenopharyngodon idella TaxID=7959 RepID=UPI00223213BB|nr:coiled-coil domain-containing protein 178 isoform X2 [Ctenopharyngodon idella]